MASSSSGVVNIEHAMYNVLTLTDPENFGEVLRGFVEDPTKKNADLAAQRVVKAVVKQGTPVWAILTRSKKTSNALFRNSIEHKALKKRHLPLLDIAICEEVGKTLPRQIDGVEATKGFLQDPTKKNADLVARRVVKAVVKWELAFWDIPTKSKETGDALFRSSIENGVLDKRHLPLLDAAIREEVGKTLARQIGGVEATKGFLEDPTKENADLVAQRVVEAVIEWDPGFWDIPTEGDKVKDALFRSSIENGMLDKRHLPLLDSAIREEVGKIFSGQIDGIEVTKGVFLRDPTKKNADLVARKVVKELSGLGAPLWDIPSRSEEIKEALFRSSIEHGVLDKRHLSLLDSAIRKEVNETLSRYVDRCFALFQESERRTKKASKSASGT